MADRFDAVVVGGFGVDTNVYPCGDALDFSVEMHFSENVDVVGGAGSYAARGFAAMGLRVAAIGYVGDDPNGAWVRTTLEEDGIDVSAFYVDPRGTKRSINFMHPDGRRRNFYDGKGSVGTQPDRLMARRLFEGTRLVHFSVVDWARHLLADARSLGCVVSCDLQDMTDPDDAYRRDFIEAADILFFSGTNFDDVRHPIARLLEYRSDATVVVGLGAQGCAIATAAGCQTFPALEAGDPVVDTNGCGDSLAVGFLVGHVYEGRTLFHAARLGQVAARHCCTLRGTSDGLITRDAAETYLAMLQAD